MASEIVEFFNVLLYGEGALFGLAIFMAIGILVAYRARFSSMIFFMILLLLNLNYWDAVGGFIDVSNNFMWSIIISYMGMAILAYIFVRDIGLVGNKKN